MTKPLTFERVTMKTFIRYTFILILVLTVYGCNKSGQQDQDKIAGESVTDDPNQALYEEVMKIHDEGMVKMGEIYRHKKKLRSKMDSVSSENKERIQVILNKLDSADKGMMNWMHEFDRKMSDFSPAADNTDTEEYRSFLEEEMEKVKKVRADIFDALKGANEFTQQ